VPSPEVPAADLSALCVGVLREDGTSRPLASDEALEAWRASLHVLEGAGATLVDIDLAEMPMLRAMNFLILSVEAATYHAPGLREHWADYGEPCRSRLLTGLAYDATDYIQAQRVRRSVRRRWGALFDHIDVLSTPSQPDVAPPLGQMASVRFTSPFNAMGWPAISVPFGAGAAGLPLATQIVAAPGRERTLLGVARALERAR
jgi:aspartyl-tRNA(Asn)/glutamyl-tRNA(Gln) amidotransferase subunit A